MAYVKNATVLLRSSKNNNNLAKLGKKRVLCAIPLPLPAPAHGNMHAPRMHAPNYLYLLIAH